MKTWLLCMWQKGMVGRTIFWPQDRDTELFHLSQGWEQRVGSKIGQGTLGQ